MGNTQRQPSPLQATVNALAVKYDPTRRNTANAASRGISLVWDNRSMAWEASAPEPRSRRHFHMTGRAPTREAALAEACHEWEHIMALYAIDERAEAIADDLDFNISTLRQVFEGEHYLAGDGHIERTTYDALDYLAALPPRNYSQEDN